MFRSTRRLREDSGRSPSSATRSSSKPRPAVAARLSAGRTAHGLHYSFAAIERARRLVCADENRTGPPHLACDGNERSGPVRRQPPGDLPPPEGARARVAHDEADGRTRLEVRQWLPDRLASPSEQGWLESFTKLDATLAA